MPQDSADLNVTIREARRGVAGICGFDNNPAGWPSVHLAHNKNALVIRENKQDIFLDQGPGFPLRNFRIPFDRVICFQASQVPAGTAATPPTALWLVYRIDVGSGFRSVHIGVTASPGETMFDGATISVERAAELSRQAFEWTEQVNAIFSGKSEVAVSRSLLPVVFHELRGNSSNALLGAELLTRIPVKDENWKAALNAVRISAVNEANIVAGAELLSTPRSKIPLSPVDLSALVRRTTDALGDLTKGKGVRLNVSIQSDLIVAAEDRLLNLLVRTLLMNAIDGADTGEALSVKCFKIDNRAQLALHVTHSKRWRDALRAALRQDVAGVSFQPGVGLSMLAAKRLVAMFDGELASPNATRGGVDLSVRLRLLPSPSNAVMIASEPAKQLTGVRCLFVDDDPSARILVSAAIRASGGDCKTAASLKDAIDIIKVWKPHVVLSDVLMPYGDGFQLLQYVREHVSNVPVVFFTATNVSDILDRATREGASLVVSKDTSAIDLARRLAILVG